MGTNCGEKSNPSTDNICNVSVGDLTQNDMPHFCTLAGDGGDSYRSEYCSKMSRAGEWGDPQQDDNGCSYNDCNNVQDYGFGCCDGCCGIIGAGLKCRRLSFTGDPLTCCFNDIACSSNTSEQNPLCFSDPGKQNTCADGKNGQPNYRSIVSIDCQDKLMQYCTGTLPSDNPNSTEWLSRWFVNGGGTGSCVYAINRNIFAAGGTAHCFSPPLPVPGICNLEPPLPIDSEGYFWSQRLVSAALEKYTAQGFAIGTLPGFPGYNPFQDFLYNTVCCPYPGICQDGLTTACSIHTSQRISLNPTLAQWCGCHLPTGEYENYSVLYNIPPECTPMCNRFGTIPIVGINAEPINCKQDICLIDGVTVNLVNSQIGGGIEFNQICNNCSNAQCSCVISNTTVDINNSTIGGNVIPVNEGCGSFTCNQINPGNTGPSTINVPCGTTAGFNPYTEYEKEVAAAQAAATKNSITWTLIIISAGLVLIFLILFFIHPMFSPQTTTLSIDQYNKLIQSTKPVTPSPINQNTISFQSSGIESAKNINNYGMIGGNDFIRNNENFVSIESR